jgi:hypothetical protein
MRRRRALVGRVHAARRMECEPEAAQAPAGFTRLAAREDRDVTAAVFIRRAAAAARGSVIVMVVVVVIVVVRVRGALVGVLVRVLRAGRLPRVRVTVVLVVVSVLVRVLDGRVGMRVLVLAHEHLRWVTMSLGRYPTNINLGPTRPVRSARWDSSIRPSARWTRRTP